MKQSAKKEVIIIGGGCAGLSAAIYTARALLNPLVIQGNLPGGQLTQTTEVENFPGFPEGIQGIDLMERMKKQAERFGAQFLQTEVKELSLIDERNKQLHLSNGETLLAESVIVATGTYPRRLNVPGEQELFGGKGISACATCDGFFFRNEVVCVIGGGDSACEEALYLSKLCSKVYLMHRRDVLRASKIMADRVQKNEKIELLWNTLPEAFVADEQGYLRAIRITDKETNETREVACKGVFLAIGWRPNTKPFEKVLKLDKEGYICVNGTLVTTSVPGVFAAGDCVDKKYQQACVAAGMGIQAALEAERWLMGV